MTSHSTLFLALGLTLFAYGCDKNAEANESKSEKSEKSSKSEKKSAKSGDEDKGEAKEAKKKGPAGLAGRCDYRTVDSSCADYMTKVLDESGATPELQQQMCTANKGKWAEAEACVATKRLGTCTDDEGYIRHYYSDGAKPYTAASAKAACFGKWEPAGK